MRLKDLLNFSHLVLSIFLIEIENDNIKILVLR